MEKKLAGLITFNYLTAASHNEAVGAPIGRGSRVTSGSSRLRQGPPKAVL